MTLFSELGVALADLAVTATALLIVGLVTVGLMRRASAASRHLVLMATLTSVLLLPLARVALPALPLPVLPAATSSTTALVPTNGAPADSRETSNEIAALTSPATVQPAFQPAHVHWPALIVAAWLTGGMVLLLRSLLGAIGLWRLSMRAGQTDDERLLSEVRRLSDELRITRRVRTLIADDDSMPVTWGIARPTLLLPSNIGDWRTTAPERLDTVLVHELAHVARFDALAHLLARIACALLWFHPLVWMASRWARLESERACDDIVLSRGARASSYADELVALSQTLSAPTPEWTIAQAMARRSQVERRVLAILDARVNRRGLSRVSAALAILLIFAMLPVAAARVFARPAEIVPGAAGADRMSGLPEAPMMVSPDAVKADLAALDALVRHQAPRASSFADSPTLHTGAATQSGDVLNVTGTWVIEGDMSTPKNFAAFGDVFTMAQDATHLHVDMVEMSQAIHFVTDQNHGQSQSQLGPSTSRPVSLTYLLDGSEIQLPVTVEHELPSREARSTILQTRPVQSVSKAAIDGKTLVITTTTTSETERFVPAPSVKSTMTQTIRYVLSLDADGRLAVDRTITVDLGSGPWLFSPSSTAEHTSSGRSVYRKSAGW